MRLEIDIRETKTGYGITDDTVDGIKAAHKRAAEMLRKLGRPWLRADLHNASGRIVGHLYTVENETPTATLVSLLDTNHKKIDEWPQKGETE